MNPMDMMGLVGRFNIFRSQHPKFILFLKSLSAKGLEEGSIMEIKVKDTDGGERLANIKLTKDDIETLKMIRSMKQGQ